MQSNYLETPVELATAATSSMHCIDCGAVMLTSKPYEIVAGAAWLAEHIRRIHHRRVPAIPYALEVFASLSRN